MMNDYFIASLFASIVLIAIVYWHSGFQKIKDCYMMWFSKDYWTSYNVVEFVAWLAKGVIIVPGLLFGIQIWWFYALTLVTSLALIWASNKKLLPTLVGFNTLWVWMSCYAIAKHFS